MKIYYFNWIFAIKIDLFETNNFQLRWPIFVAEFRQQRRRSDNVESSTQLDLDERILELRNADMHLASENLQTLFVSVTIYVQRLWHCNGHSASVNSVEIIHKTFSLTS